MKKNAVQHDTYASVRLGYRSHTHVAPIMPDCLRNDGRDMSQRRPLGGVWRAGVTSRNEKSLTRRTLSTQEDFDKVFLCW